MRHLITLSEHHFSTLLFDVPNIFATVSIVKPLSLNVIARFFTSLEYDLRGMQHFLLRDGRSLFSDASLISELRSSSDTVRVVLCDIRDDLTLLLVVLLLFTIFLLVPTLTLPNTLGLHCSLALAGYKINESTSP